MKAERSICCGKTTRSRVLWRKLRVAYTYVIRSREFAGQEQPDRFGSVGFTFRF
jgi:hypothetical protein